MFIIYLAAINLIAFFMMGIDKRKAIKGAWRIPEKTLFTAAFLGGGLGILLGMKVFRHKTKHLSFKLGIPAVILLQIAAFWYFFLR